MHIEMRPITDIRPYENNPRQNDAAVDAVAASIRSSVSASRSSSMTEGVIIVGHTRYKAAQKLGLTEVPVHVAKGLTPEQTRPIASPTTKRPTWRFGTTSNCR